ncbi:hypothetical protein [Roseateles amylovorans]|uniref:Uncharacterized protein n=1 Tax=Roseateles amylovorans TaxID=2978473 RepID=A0ABY6AUZ6_9BURK|nr:hypothetical protein [Roseateles amylovorans]UXH76194.1 hypothetical protein N4261_14055 [Roseateles amylovorans]
MDYQEMTELKKLVEFVSVEQEDDVNYVFFVFPVEEGSDQEGLQFQWADSEATVDGLYMELGDQFTGAYGKVSAIEQRGEVVVVSRTATAELPFTELRLDCTAIDKELVKTAVDKVASVLAR